MTYTYIKFETQTLGRKAIALLGKNGIKELQKIMGISTLPYTRILSPSPFCRMTYSEDEILKNWSKIKDFL